MVVDEPRHFCPIDATVELLDISNVLQQEIQVVGNTRCPKQMRHPFHHDPSCCFVMGISLCTWSLWGCFFSASWTAFRAVRTASWTAFRAVRTAASWLFC
jgi:hypothetical protein